MGLFVKSENTQAYLKAGFMGFAGDGKTFTASSVAIGLVETMRQKGLEQGSRPVMFLDSETGSDWVKPRFDDAKIDLYVAKTRAFTDLLEAVREAEKAGSVLIIDSLTHFWRELCDSYLAKKNQRSRDNNRRTQSSLQFQDWAVLKSTWGQFTDLFVNSHCHAILCGRAGYEYDMGENDDGRKELEKTGVKMKAETETGYEPSILVLMEKHRDMKTGRIWRTASVLKDRSTRLDGKTFQNPTFETFLPHIEFLNLGGQQLGVDTSRTSDDLFAGDDGAPSWKYEQQQKEIALDEILEVMKKHHGGQTEKDKKARQSLLEKHAGTLSWKKVETFSFAAVCNLRNAMWEELEGRTYGTNGACAPQAAEEETQQLEFAEEGE